MKKAMRESKTTFYLAALWGFVSGLLAFMKTGAPTQFVIYFLGAVIVGALICMFLGCIWSLVSKIPHHIYSAASWILIIGIAIRLVRLAAEYGAGV